MAITDFLLGDQARTEASIAKLQSRLAVEGSEVDACTRRRNSALLAIDEADGSASTKDADAALVSLADARKAVEKTEGALSAATERLAGLQRNDDAAMSAKAQAARAEMRKDVARLVHERSVSVTSMRTALQRFAQDRAAFKLFNAEIYRMGVHLGAGLTSLDCGLNPEDFELKLQHEFTVLGIVKPGIAWTDPTAERPSIVKFVEGGNAAILAAVGATHE